MQKPPAGGKPRTDPGTHERIRAIVRAVPSGRVATYGQVAALAGLPSHARLVGYALHASRPSDELPWWRVVNARGEISARSDAAGRECAQRELLESEGVRFGRNGRIDLERFRWDPLRESFRPVPERGR